MSPISFVITAGRCAIVMTLAVGMMPCVVRAAPEPTASNAPVASPSAVATDATDDPCGGPSRLLATLDRPTFGYSACAVPKGSIVLENGYQNQVQGGDSPSVTTTIGQGFQRVGIADRIELDLIAPTFNRSSSGGTLTSGYSDVGLGFKIELPQRGRFTYAVDGLYTAATGTGGFTTGGPSQTLNFDVAYALSPAVGIGSTLGFVSAAGNYTSLTSHFERYGFALPSVVVTAQIPNAYQFFVEFVGQTKIGPAQGGRIFTDFGVQKLLSHYFELDAEYGTSFTPVGGARYHAIGFGAGIRVK